MSLPRRAALGLANLAAFALLAFVAATWGWRWFGPARVALPAPAPADPVAALAVSPPFGVAPAGQAIPAAPEAAVGGPRLLGVLAERDGRGRALLRLADGSARLAAVGDTVEAGTTLAAVHPEGVTLRTGAAERRLALRTPGSAAGAAPRGTCVPPGYRGPVVRLNAELVSGLIAQPEALAAVVGARDGALVVQGDSGLAALLGLKSGDRVQQANGIALRAPQDVIVAVLRPLAASQPVRVTGARGSEAREFLIVNAGACPP